jgi:hypothetical protein
MYSRVLYSATRYSYKAVLRVLGLLKLIRFICTVLNASKYLVNAFTALLFSVLKSALKYLW